MEYEIKFEETHTPFVCKASNTLEAVDNALSSEVGKGKTIDSVTIIK